MVEAGLDRVNIQADWVERGVNCRGVVGASYGVGFTVYL